MVVYGDQEYRDFLNSTLAKGKALVCELGGAPRIRN
jgi:hypothetical protein